MNLEKLQTTRESYLTVIRQHLERIEEAKHLSDVVQFNAIFDAICKKFQEVKSLNKTIEGLSDIHSLKDEIILAEKHSLDIEIKLRHLEEYRKSHAFVVEQQISVDCQESPYCTGPLNTFTQNNEQRPNKSFLKRSLSFDSLRKGPVGKNDSFIRAVEIYVQNKPNKRKLQRSQSCEKLVECGKTTPWVRKRSSSCDGRIENTKKISIIRDLASQEEFGNWTKCVLALNRTREALLSPVKVEFQELVMSFPEDEFAIFRKCLKCRNVNLNEKTRGRNLKREDTKKKLWECEHTSCETIFKELLGNLRANNKWTVIIIQNSGSSQSGKLENESSDCAWEIGRLYTYAESAEEESTYSTIAGLDVAKIIKLMRCCKLFEFDGCDEVYEEVLKKRNLLMHSPDNMTSNEELTETFKRLCKLLEKFLKFPACEGALAELQKFEQDALVVDIESPEFRRQEEEALQLQAAALEEEVLKSKEVAESLHLLLKSTSDRLERIQAEQEEERDRMKSEISRLKEIHQELSIKVDSDSKKYTSLTKTFEKHDDEVKSIKYPTTKDSSPEKSAVQKFQQTVDRQINDRYYTKLTQLQQSYDDLKLKNQTLQDEIKSLHSQDLENKTDNPNLRLNNYDLINATEEIKKLQKTISELEHKNNTIKNRFIHNKSKFDERNAQLNEIINKLAKQNDENTKAMEEHEISLKNKLAQLAEKNSELTNKEFELNKEVSKNKELEIKINEARKEISKMRETAATEIASLKAQNEKITKQNETWVYLNDKIKLQSQNMDTSEVRRRVEMVLVADESALSEINKVLGKTSGN